MNDDSIKKDEYKLDDILNESISEDNDKAIKDLQILNPAFFTQQLLDHESELNLDIEISMSNINSSHEHFKALSDLQDSSLGKYTLDKDRDRNRDRGGDKDKAEQFIPHYHNPIDLVNYLETVYIRQRLEANDSIFQIKNYKYSKSKINVLQFQPKPTLSSRIFRGGNLITSIASKGDLLLSGNNIGVIKKFSIENENELESLFNTEIEVNKTRSVVCMDISEEKDYLISGYSNGYMALWDIRANKCQKIIKEVHSDCVIACKFIKAENKTYEILSADLKGHVYETIITEGFFSTSVDFFELITNSVPIFLIEVLKFTKEEKKAYTFCNEDALVVAFGSLENITVYQIEPVMKELLVFDRPTHKNIYFIPDFSFGIGYSPKPSSAEEENEIGFNLYLPYVLFAISWNNIITLYILPMTAQGGVEKLLLTGHYVNSAPILRLGFLSLSIIYFFDKNKNIKVINTSLMTYGDIQRDSSTDMPIAITNQFTPPELEEGIVQDIDILFQTYVPDIVDKKKQDPNSKLFSAKATYNNYILSQPKTLMLLGKKQFHYGKLLNWEQCLNYLQQNSESMIAMSLGLDIFHGRILSLPDIPIDEGERKKKVKNILNGLIIQYAVINTQCESNNQSKPKSKANSNNNNNKEDPFINCINICIEFCIEINNFDLLMTVLQPMFDSKNYGEIFIERLEPFILCDKIAKQQLGNLTISKIIDIYIKKSNYQVLSQILIHLDIESIDVDNIKAVCSEHHLITPLIYIYMNGNDEDYFYPVHLIFEIYLTIPELPLSEFVSYTEYLRKNGIGKLELSKPYIGHKLLWYIDMCLSGDRFLNRTRMAKDKHEVLVIKVMEWLLDPDVFDILIEFDSYSVFYLISRVFLEENLAFIIENYSTRINEQGIGQGLGMEQKIINKLSLCQTIIRHCLKATNPLVLEDFYNFIVKVSIHIPLLSKDILIKAAEYLLTIKGYQRESSSKSNNNNNSNDSQPQAIDYFSIHTKSYDDPDHLSSLSLKLIDMLESREDISNDDLFSILIKSESSPYVNVTLHLLNKLSKYNECLQMYLTDTRIDNKTERSFEWIEDTLLDLHTYNESLFDAFQSNILDNISKLADLSIDRLSELITTWFNANHNKVIQKLEGNDKLQLLYVNKNLDTFKEDELEGEDLKNYQSLLSIHMELLFKLSRQEEILSNLQKRQMYPTVSLLEQCKKEKIYDAALFLFKKTGAIEEAMVYFLDLLSKTFDSIVYSIQTNESNDKLFMHLSHHREHLSRCIEICEVNSDKSSQMDQSEAMWFKLLQVFYDMLTTIDDTQSIELKGAFDDLRGTICRNINEVLEKMVSYVRIQEIIDNVTNNYKQAEFKEFKGILVDVLASYSYIRNIMSYANVLVKNSLSGIMEEYNADIGKGNHYCLDKCDQCNGGFAEKSKAKIYLFRCGHKIHGECILVYGGEKRIVLCPACKSIEDQKSLITKGDVGYIDQISPPIVYNKHKEIVSMKESNQKQKIFDDLNCIDKKYHDTFDFLTSNLL